MKNKPPYFISDTHFHHTNIIEYCDRPFSSIEEMNEYLIEKWNSKVDPGDHIYHIGDIALCRPKKLKKILDRLNGKIHLIRGNHEGTALKCSEYFEWIKDHYVLNLNHWSWFKDCNIQVVMMHYPIEAWYNCHYGTIHVHGHVHSGNVQTMKNRFDVGVDSWNYEPISIVEIVENLDQPVKELDSKQPSDPPLEGFYS